MARAEQIERSRFLAEPFDHAPIRLNLVRRPRVRIVRDLAREPPILADRARRRESAHALGLRQPRDGLTVARAEALECQPDASAAALSKVRSERAVHPRHGGTVASRE